MLHLHGKRVDEGGSELPVLLWSELYLFSLLKVGVEGRLKCVDVDLTVKIAQEDSGGFSLVLL
jgi:hypothetical protein